VMIFSLLYGGILVLVFRNSIKPQLAFAGLMSLILAYFAGQHWPGHLSYDALIDYETGLRAINNPVTQIFYSSLHYAFVLLWHSMASSMVLNLMLALFFFTFVYSQARHRWSDHLLMSLCLFFFLGSKMNQHLMIFQNRDITFTWCFLLFLAVFSRPQIRWSFRILLFILSVCIRKETILLFPLVVVFELLRSKESASAVLRRFILPAVILAAYIGGTPYIRLVNMDQVYTVTSYLNPMMHILHKHGRTILKPAEAQQLSGILDIDRAIEIHNPVDIDEFHLNAVNREHLKAVGGEDRIRKVALRLFRDYPADFIENRIFLAGVMLGFSEKSYWFNNEAFLNPLFKQLQTALPTAVYSDGPKAWRVVSAARELDWYRLLLASCLPALLLISLSLIFWRRAPNTAMASVLLIARTCVVLLFSPAGYYKYVWSLSVWGAFVLALAWAEWKFHSRHEVRL